MKFRSICRQAAASSVKDLVFSQELMYYINRPAVAGPRVTVTHVYHLLSVYITWNMVVALLHVLSNLCSCDLHIFLLLEVADIANGFHLIQFKNSNL